jgi:hypothetical protein
MWRALALGLVVAGCHASLADDPGELMGGVDASQSGGQLDASGSGGGVDSGGSVPLDAPAVAARVVFLNFEGVTLTKGTSDATANTASWLFNATTGTAPAYEANKATRDADIATIFNGVTTRLAGIATVTQTRPATGPYVMIIFGGGNATIHSAFGTAVNELDCGDLVKNDVAWIAESVAPTNAINTTMGAIGFGLGLTATTNTGDCMCSWANNCQPAGACTLHNGIARDPNVSNNPNTGQPQSCAGTTTQDELTTFQTAFQ